jgi:hypothetical protein
VKLALALFALAAAAQEPAEVRARWEVEARSIEVGEPFAATLVVEHPAGAKVEVDFSAVESDLAWLVAGEPSRVADGAAQGADVATRWICSLAALEPGKHAIPAPAISVVGRDGKRIAAEVAAADVEPAGVLGSGEDAPREPKDFRPVEPERAGFDAGWIAGLAACALLAIAAFVLWFRRRGRETSKREPGPLERLDAIGARDLDDAEVVRELHYELTGIVRRHFDALDGLSRGALTDDEWVAAVAAAHAARADELRELMRAADAVKYGCERPTRWAVSEQIERAKRLVRTAAAPAKATAA